VKLFISDKGFAKLNIALAKGKKAYDKRDDIRKKDLEREMNRKF
jgi:SsrA-binding protein